MSWFFSATPDEGRGDEERNVEGGGGAVVAEVAVVTVVSAEETLVSLDDEKKVVGELPLYCSQDISISTDPLSVRLPKQSLGHCKCSCNRSFI